MLTREKLNKGIIWLGYEPMRCPKCKEMTCFPLGWLTANYANNNYGEVSDGQGTYGVICICCGDELGGHDSEKDWNTYYCIEQNRIKKGIAKRRNRPPFYQ